ncbi:hypothetical protein EW146_g4904 [Bondarzewia mesenterica]|uniref:Uncharacterized protein n=1 Tax=Bondarzewia mesenterica TaxID=1095465 RepID=A0A4S4LT57_9AGAM|nr:hypothetical protein EW146_g4904 [Bondarzewia mesenterica]
MSEQELVAAHTVDTEFLVRRSMTKGYQLFSLLTPPIYVASTLFRRGRGHITVNRFLRATWLGGAAGIASGGAFEYVRSANSSAETLRTRTIRATYDTSSLRADDHATIGALLFAVVIPAIFWKRGTSFNLILGGAGIGSAAGLLTHFGKAISGDAPPKSEVQDSH